MNQITFQAVGQPQDAADFNIGQVGQTPGGNVYLYIQANGALAKGSAVVPTAVSTASNCASSADVLGRLVYITPASSPSWTNGQFAGSFVTISAGTGVGQLAYVIDNTATTLQLSPGSALTTALSSADSAITISKPYYVTKSAVTSKLQNCMGVAQAAFNDQQYGWVLTRGVGVVAAGVSLTPVGADFVTGDSTTGQVILGTTAKGPFDEQSLGRILVVNPSGNQLATVFVEI